MKSRLTFWSFLSTLVFIFSALPTAGHGQATRTVSTVERRIEVLSRQAKDFERDNMGKPGSRKNDAEAAKRTRQTRQEIEEDLTALQTAYNSLVLELQTSKTLKPGFVAEAARGLKKSSSRLKSNLVLPVAGTTEPQKPSTPPDSERARLNDLCKTIYAFITNPIFEVPGSLDVKESTRAGHDLDLILQIAILLSEADANGSK